MDIRKWLLLTSIIVIASCTNCNNDKTNLSSDGEQEADSTETDSIKPDLVLFDKEHIPTSADANFEDFLYAFLTDEEFAEQRVSDSLLIDGPDTSKVIGRDEWNDMHLFKYQELYSYLFTSDSDEELIKSPDLEQVAFEWVKPDSLNCDRYEFSLLANKWTLTHVIRQKPLEKTYTDFLTFYRPFINDKDFQEESISFPITLTYGTDSEMDDGETYKLSAEEWKEFHSQSPMPDKTIVFMDYGQKLKLSSTVKLLVRSITESVFAQYTFKRSGSHWKLCTIETI